MMWYLILDEFWCNVNWLLILHTTAITGRWTSLPSKQRNILKERTCGKDGWYKICVARRTGVLTRQQPHVRTRFCSVDVHPSVTRKRSGIGLCEEDRWEWRMWVWDSLLGFFGKESGRGITSCSKPRQPMKMGHSRWEDRERYGVLVVLDFCEVQFSGLLFLWPPACGVWGCHAHVLNWFPSKPVWTFANCKQG
jgi:hypothetical protein